MRFIVSTIAGGLLLAAASPASAVPPPVKAPSVAETEDALTHGDATSEQLVKHYLDTIASLDAAGPALHSVIAVNPNALADARKLDAERKVGHVRSPLHGVPILIKDNIESADDMATTAGSLALAGNVTGRDAPVVARLRAAGAVILGKTNLSEWANIRSSRSVSGWSGVGGLVKNPYVLDRNACGSSSGTGAAIAASLAVVGVGTETDGSVTCPSAMNGLAGIKPTVGLVSRTHIVPISHSQDTAGPMGRSVADVAAMLTVMAGSDSRRRRHQRRRRPQGRLRRRSARRDSEGRAARRAALRQRRASGRGGGVRQGAGGDACRREPRSWRSPTTSRPPPWAKTSSP